MAQFKNAMEIFKLLDKSNCKKCNKPTCLSFAGAVFTGEKNISECPVIPKDIIEKYNEKQNVTPLERDMIEAVEKIKRQISETDLSSAAKRLGTKFDNEKITVRMLGKEVSVDKNGNISTDIHVHQWLAAPIYNYIISGAGVPVSKKWVPLRELEGGKSWYRLFGQRCEKPLKKVADNYTELFDDMIRLFNGKQVENHYNSDISLVLHPLPKVPVLICYWKPDEGLDSDLNIFFDSRAEKNLNIESIYALTAGLVVMFEKISLRHGI
jgi:hypothetical protein